MKKKILVFILFISSMLCFSEELLGFNGITFGTTKETVCDVMQKKGWELYEPWTDHERATFEKGLFAGVKVYYVTYYFYKNQFYKAHMEIKTRNQDEVENILGIQKEKYKLSYQETKRWGSQVRGIYSDEKSQNYVNYQKGSYQNPEWYWYELEYTCKKLEEARNSSIKTETEKAHENDL